MILKTLFYVHVLTIIMAVVIVVDAWMPSMPIPIPMRRSQIQTQQQIQTSNDSHNHHQNQYFTRLKVSDINIDTVDEKIDVVADAFNTVDDDDVDNDNAGVDGLIGTNTTTTTTTKSSSLPDFGKTTIEVDTIKLVKKRRKRETKKKASDGDDYDTTVGMEKQEIVEDKNSKWIRKDLFGSSLVDQTMDELKKDTDFQSTLKRVEKVGLAGISREERTQRRRALDNLNVEPFAKFVSSELKKKQQQQQETIQSGTAMAEEEEEGDHTISSSSTSIPPVFHLQRKIPKILQINIGLYCNQACGHCHVESSPMRTTEMMTTQIAAQCLTLLKNTPSITTLDITGGAPELNDNFRYLVSMARAIRGPSLIIIDRCNLTVLQEPGQEDLVDFLKEHRVQIVASLPCYSEDNVDTQRGNGVFERSISALLALNQAGYGHHQEQYRSDNLQLDLVYNPLGAFLPPPQDKLQAQYTKQLEDNFGILFNSLYTITNMPIKRFADFLHRRGELEEYMELLVRNFNADTLTELMCLDTINIAWDGKIYDCDFNQQLGYSIGVDSIHQGGKTVFDIDSLDELQETKIRTDNHCFGCTAGMGSS
mmetsp:Transcript_24255/g.27044  ORF Transcript_24255/g.27044 Transcript_24255/m.27044 type:complete len:592 (+) Transcript_24255:266-2041(+)